MCLRLLAVLLLCCADPARAATVVRFETVLGDFEVELFDDRTADTVANFLAYTRDGDYDESLIHRSVPGFVVQGGARRVSGNMLPPIPQRPPVDNEFQPCDGGCNVRGTIAMAKIDMLPHSATNSWFINLADNSGYPDDTEFGLDYANEGYTVFGRVLGDGMDVVDAIAALPRCLQFAACQLVDGFPQLPLRNYAGGVGVAVRHLVVVNRVTELPEPDEALLGACALASVLLLARLSSRRAADPRP